MTRAPSFLRPSRKTVAYYGFVALSGAALIFLSANIGAIDQSDYPRAVRFMVAGDFHPFEPPIDHWPIRETMGSPLYTRSTTSLYFGALALLQRALWGFFSVSFMAAVSKTIALAFGAMTIDRLAKVADLGYVFRAACFLLLATLMVAAHASFIFASFYQEHLFYVVFPAVLWACLDPVRWRRNGLLLLLLPCCAAAKVQYFYLPLLFLVVHLVVAATGRRRVDGALCAGLLVMQAVCLYPVAGNREQNANRYHASFFGSYLVASPDELGRLGVTANQRPCIGVDAYGNRLEGERIDHYAGPYRSCVDDRVYSLRDVLSPYLVDPLIGWRLWQLVSPAHWTVLPFHVDRRIHLIVPLHGTSFGRSQAMVATSEVREAIVTRAFVWISLLSLVAVAATVLRARQRGGEAVLTIVLFLNAFVYTQIAISLLGEGVRDFAKHVMAAQFAIDLLVVVTLVSIAGLVMSGLRRRRSRG